MIEVTWQFGGRMGSDVGIMLVELLHERRLRLPFPFYLR